MPLETATLISMMELAARNGLARFEASRGGTRVRIWRDANVPRTSVASGAETAGALTGTTSSAAPRAADQDPSKSVTAPLSGLCHLSPEPGMPPFFRVGGKVEKGQTLFLIEAMKVMTSVPAPHGGTLAEVMASDGAQVEAGALLARIA